MKNLYLFIVALVITACISSCKKSAVATPIDFTQYTTTDEQDNVIGTPDATDWTLDTVWSTRESNLMLFKDTVKLTDSVAGLVEVSPAFPNPADSILFVGINTERQCKLKYVFVNTDFEILSLGSRKMFGGPIVTSYNLATSTSFHKDAYYRMYYAFYVAGDSLIYRGHGDIKIP